MVALANRMGVGKGETNPAQNLLGVFDHTVDLTPKVIARFGDAMQMLANFAFERFSPHAKSC